MAAWSQTSGAGRVPTSRSYARLLSESQVSRSRAPNARAARYDRTRVRIVVGSATELPLPTAKYDLVLCSEVIEHFPNRQSVLPEVLRVAKPGSTSLSQH